MAKAEPRSSTSGLGNSNSWVFTLVASLAAFSTYFCMYAYRKPFAAGEFKGTFPLMGSTMELKAALVLSQILGYPLSKFLGIKISLRGRLVAAGSHDRGADRGGRGGSRALRPCARQLESAGHPSQRLAIGDDLGAGRLVSRRPPHHGSPSGGDELPFIVSSGVVKDVGRWLMSHGGVSEAWMPAATGLCFLPLLVFSVWVLTKLPPASAADIAARERRRPMNRNDRWAFVWRFFTGMALLCVVYFFLSAYREVRDSFSVDVLRDLHREDWPLSLSEGIVGLVLLIAMAALYLINDNRRALVWAFAVMIAGTVLLGLSTLLYDRGAISGVAWMVLIGLGAYLAYVPYNTLLFERMMASTRFLGTAVFAIALADATGYTGVVIVYLCKEFAFKQMHWLAFLRGFTYFMSATGTVCLLGAAYYFLAVVPRVGAAGEENGQTVTDAGGEPVEQVAEA